MLIGVRPEDLEFASRGGGSARLATLAGREWLGPEEIIELDIDGHRVAMRTPGDGTPVSRDLRVGSTVHVTAPESKLHHFDETSGRRRGRPGERS